MPLRREFPYTSGMKRLFTAFTVLPFLFFTACAEKAVWVTTQGELALDRDDLRELHEAFKTSSEKTITLENQKQEVDCDGHACPLLVPAKATYRRQDSTTTEKNVEASLVFGREDSQKILQLLEKARYENKELSLSGQRGSVWCAKSACRIKFSLSRELRGYSKDVLP